MIGQPEYFHGQLLFVSIVVSLCGVGALLVFIAWLGRSRKRKRDNRRADKKSSSTKRKQGR
jgi:hypothetical protein